MRMGPHPHALYALRATPFGLAAALRAAAYSHSIVEGGFDEMS